MSKQRSFLPCLILAGLMSAPAAGAPLVGGYTKQDPSRKEYLEVAKTAEKLMNEMHPGTDFRAGKLLEVYTQVVAGMNYRLICEYTDKAGGGTRQIVLFRTLKGVFSITKEEAVEPPPAAAQTRFEYATTFGGTIVVELLPEDRISVAYGKVRHVLPRAISGSGARYSEDGVTFWMKGQEATFENEKTDEKVRCRHP